MVFLIVTDKPECYCCAGKEWDGYQGHFICNPNRFYTRTTQGHRRTGKNPDCLNHIDERKDDSPNIRQQLINLLRSGS